MAMAYQNLAEIQVGFENWTEARQAAARAVALWQHMQESGSRRLEPHKMSRAYALLRDCDAHLN
jgi:hypothetical protein